MTTIYDKLILFICCCVHMVFYFTDYTLICVASLLCAVIVTCLCSYMNPHNEKALSIQEHYLYYLLLLIYLVFAFFVPAFCIYLPVIVYDILYTGHPALLLLAVLAGLYCIGIHDSAHLLIWCAIVCFSLLLHNKTTRIQYLDTELKHLRDTSTEYSLLLAKQNKSLIEKQDAEIHMATLKERNRIAREIHDNVGHMLSRSLLQVGALLAINQQAQLTDHLTALKDTLSTAMNSIRESVHDLHDDSIDLSAATKELIDELTDRYHISFDYDMGNHIPRSIKYCYITIVKEALANVIKHSNATDIRIVMREHPSFFQLLIEDNGTAISKDLNSSGIGLENMRERIDSFHGTLTINTNNGFRIFISIPKSDNLL